MFISFVFKIKLHLVLFYSSEFNAESLAEFIPETNYLSETDKSARYKFGVWANLGPKLASSVSMSVLKTCLQTNHVKTNLRAKFVCTPDLFPDDLSVYDNLSWTDNSSLV